MQFTDCKSVNNLGAEHFILNTTKYNAYLTIHNTQ